LEEMVISRCVTSTFSPVLITRSVFDPITTGKNVEEDWAGAVLLPGVFALLSTVVGGG
jgi:hypothetical protein